MDKHSDGDAGVCQKFSGRGVQQAYLIGKDRLSLSVRCDTNCNSEEQLSTYLR